jgi:hypothetical protein
MPTAEIALKPGYVLEGIDWHDLYSLYADRLEGLAPATIEAFKSRSYYGTDEYIEAEVQAELDCYINLFKVAAGATYKVLSLDKGFLFIRPDHWPLTCRPLELEDLAPFEEIKSMVDWVQKLIDMNRIKEVR